MGHNLRRFLFACLPDRKWYDKVDTVALQEVIAYWWINADMASPSPTAIEKNGEKEMYIENTSPKTNLSNQHIIDKGL